MSNTFGAFMSYCRQQGAKQALVEALDQVVEYQEDDELYMSPEEATAFEFYIKHVYDWMCDMCLIDGEGAFDSNELEELVNELKGECE